MISKITHSQDPKIQTLEFIFLNNNLFQNTIPTEIGKTKKLAHIDLSDNLFSGTVPIELLLLNYLKEVTIQNNQFEGNLDIFCDKNLTKESGEVSIRDEDFDISYEFDLGVKVDCTSRIQCRCCICK